MGATNIHYEVPKKEFESPRAAYRALVEEEQYNYGHDPYSGTIANCNFMGRVRTPKDKDEYWEIVEQIGKRECAYYEEEDKWIFVGLAPT